ncbi:uncharacterized protein [Spinacia oleracea]|uniref:Uncharacterized protein n=1 Tax=Spinacia oleracea TaxID=3562 RepID=A0ABM3R204_SPIOL|nr:uncharacterized protein LOC130464211 [Spinacia oleracea]
MSLLSPPKQSSLLHSNFRRRRRFSLDTTKQPRHLPSEPPPSPPPANAFSEHRQTLLRTSSLTPKKSGRKSSIRMRQQKKKADLEMEDMVLREAVRIEEELKAGATKKESTNK